MFVSTYPFIHVGNYILYYASHARSFNDALAPSSSSSSFKVLLLVEQLRTQFAIINWLIINLEYNLTSFCATHIIIVLSTAPLTMFNYVASVTCTSSIMAGVVYAIIKVNFAKSAVLSTSGHMLLESGNTI